MQQKWCYIQSQRVNFQNFSEGGGHAPDPPKLLGPYQLHEGAYGFGFTMIWKLTTILYAIKCWYEYLGVCDYIGEYINVAHVCACASSA